MTTRYLGWAVLVGLGAAACAFGCSDDFNEIGDAPGDGGSASVGGSGGSWNLGGSAESGNPGGSGGSGGSEASGGSKAAGGSGGSEAAGGSGGSGGGGGTDSDTGSGASGGGGAGHGSGASGVSGGLGGSGASGNSGGAAGANNDDYCDVIPIFEESCNGRICHGDPGRPAEFATDLFNIPAREFIDQPANYALVANPSECPTDDPELLIDSNSPSKSLILTKILGTHACGLMMPNTSEYLTKADIDCVFDWVNGVLANSGPTNTTSSTTGGGEIPATFETVERVITYSSISCVSSDCHGGVEGRLDLRTDAGLYDRLLTWQSDVCGKPVVTPGDPAQSAFIQTLTTGCGDLSPDCLIGDECIPRMPLYCTEGFDCIPPDYIDALSQWIANGAPRD